MSLTGQNLIETAISEFDFETAFNAVGWDYFQGPAESVTVDDETYQLQRVAQKRDAAVYRVEPNDDGEIPPRSVRKKIDREVTKISYEHLLVYADLAETRQIWQWVKRRPGENDKYREHTWYSSQDPERLVRRFRDIEVQIDEEEALTLSDLRVRLKDAFDREEVTKQFYRDFDDERTSFLDSMEGIELEDDKEWYGSVLLSRLMFIYFLQRKGFLDNDRHYLKNRLEECQERFGEDEFYSFYQTFLLHLFHDGLGQPEDDRDEEMRDLLGEVPYLDGGFFQVHEVEAKYDIDIPDEAFERLFEFFDDWDWTLDYRPISTGNEINPDVLGYIFEQYVNRKQMGAYYTKEDVTGYITRNTVIPYILREAKRAYADGFTGSNGVWSILEQSPDAYIHPSVQQTERDDEGNPKPFPEEIQEALDDFEKRDRLNEYPPEDTSWGLPTETWRETVARRKNYEEVRSALASGEVDEVDQLVTLNLDIEEFVHDAIRQCDDPDLLRAFRDAIRNVKVLDPACGSGAFLFSALERLERLYTACLEQMEEFIGDLDTQDNGHPEKYRDFREEIEDAYDKRFHPNLTYFVLKRILLDNLYGVDIMPEAVEICKLRLFLKLAAQVDKADNLEPLPDMDFNLRAGNAIVGYATREEALQGLKVSMESGRQGQINLMFEDEQDALDEIEKKLGDVARLTTKFREQQTSLGGQVTTEDKQALNDSLAELTERLDYACAMENGVSRDDEEAYEEWKATHRPLHWFAEFYDVMSDDGFDVVIGNPPYVSKTKIDYSPRGHNFRNIYANMTSRSVDLTHDRGAHGLIVPLNITFSSLYSRLRETILPVGKSWFSSFDNIPAKIFEGVSQRCTIWISHRDTTNCVNSSPMYRWRSDYREHLMGTIIYNEVEESPSFFKEGIPKIGSDTQVEVLRLTGRDRYNPDREESNIRFSTTARNFVSAFQQPPPRLHVDSLEEASPSNYGEVEVGSEGAAHSALALLAGEFHLWYWLVRGDGFHLTKWMVTEFFGNVLPKFNGESEDQGNLGHLTEIGEELWERRNEALVFKKNAGKFVGNYNWLRLLELTRRADLLAMSHLGLDASQAEHIFDYISRVLSINVRAGEKAIPAEVKAKFPPLDDPREDFNEVDEKICSHFGWSDEELSAILNEEANPHVAQV